MLRTMKSMENYTIGATDGVIGHVKDFYFDDDAWVVRYLVVQTGDWLSNRKVLISPMAIAEPNWIDKTFPVSLTQAQVKNSPDIDTAAPSRSVRFAARQIARSAEVERLLIVAARVGAW